MKKLLLIAFLSTASLVQAQTKGTNTLGFGLNFQENKLDQNWQGSQLSNEQQTKGMSLGYGHFVNDNTKLGIDFFYGSNDNSFGTTQFNSNTYGGNLNYQKYYPLFKKFYAFGGGQVGYNYSSGTEETAGQIRDLTANAYSVGAFGGLTWFFSKRLALEANLLSANVGYNKTKDEDSDPLGGTFKSSSTNFNLTTTGAINGLGFKIYFLF